ncbi:hypothetical protein BSPP4475_05515 [Brevibacillus aydinogluensis]|uniref:Uncharacterized protein n=1 Tax=Brevibacillus aydinogluensis TaxID=927786 RepID=A0AA48M8X6_9BACL|nr:hypothetical protein BSPP4475_05515 [Brevibacillus aydinogluensis]
MKLTYALLKKCQADLEMFALSTKDKQAKQVYEKDAEHLQRVIDQVKPFLTQ